MGSVADPATGERVEKAVFVVFFAGERARQKILKICEAFSANRYPFPDDLSRQRQMNAEVWAPRITPYRTISQHLGAPPAGASPYPPSPEPSWLHPMPAR